MNPYNTNPSPFRPWWKTTPALLGLLALVALLGAVSLGLGFLVMIAAMVAMWVLPSWRWYARLGATFGAFFLLLLSAGMSGQLDDSGADKSEARAMNADDAGAETTPSLTPTKAPELADYTGKPLDKAEKGARAAGFTSGRHDASAEGLPIAVRNVPLAGGLPRAVPTVSPSARPSIIPRSRDSSLQSFLRRSFSSAKTACFLLGTGR
ncbi:hypothetical protein [Streptomyces yanii]|uniref:Uncharacterized protein n=1 Tax=Streptomyces yanii TaxID=78510 RepID=A0ABV5QZ98_9ACTN